MEISRRGLILALPLLVVARPSLAAASVYRVSGVVTAKNYKGLESFLFNSLDKVVGLKILFQANKDAAEGAVAAYEEDGLFIAYFREPKSESQISTRKGFSQQGDSFRIDGFFDVAAEGMHQGITPLILDLKSNASGAKVIDLDINRLKAGIRD